MSTLVIGLGGCPMNPETFELYEWSEFVTMYNDATAQLATLRAEVERLTKCMRDADEACRKMEPIKASILLTNALLPQGGRDE